MIRVILLLLVLFIGCSESDRSTSNDVNQEQTEQADSEVESGVGLDEERNTEIQHSQSESGSSSTKRNIIFWLVVITLVIASLIGIYVIRKSYKDRISFLESRVDYYKDKCIDKNDILRDAKKRIDLLNESLVREKEQKKELKESILQLRSEKSDTELDRQTKEVTDIETQKETDKEPKVKSSVTELYFTVPNGHGKFKHENGIRSFEEKRLYKLNFQKGKSEATIEFISSKYDGVAINLKDSMIKPACSIIKENENNPSSIHQLSPGIVKRDGEEWIIENKIKVEIR